MLMAETEKYAVELSIEPHMPAEPFLVGGNTDGISLIWIAFYIMLFVFLCFFQVGNIKVEELELTRPNFRRKEDVRKFNDKSVYMHDYFKIKHSSARQQPS